MAHEVIGHYEAWRRGTTQAVAVLEEVQASIRASKFGIDLSNHEREMLLRDALERLEAANIKLEDVEKYLDIWRGDIHADYSGDAPYKWWEMGTLLRYL